MNKKSFAVAATFTAVSYLAVSAAEVSYDPADESSGPYSWTTEANWSGGTLPAEGDDVVLSASRLAAEKLVLGTGESAAIAGLYVGMSMVGEDAAGPCMLDVSGALTNTAAAYVGCRSTASGPVRGGIVTVRAGGEWVSHGNVHVAHDGNPGVLTVEAGASMVISNSVTDAYMRIGSGKSSYGVVTNRGSMYVQKYLDIGDNTGSTGSWGRFDNFGHLTVSNALRIGMNTGAGGVSVFHHHRGATLTKICESQYVFYIGGRSTGHCIFDESVTFPSEHKLCLGIYGAYRGDMFLNYSAVIDPGNEIRMGYGNESENYIWMKDSSRITGDPTINVGYAKGSCGYVSLSNNAAIVSTGTMNVGGKESLTKLSKGGYVDLWDSSSISAGTNNVGAGATDGGCITLHDQSRIDGAAKLMIGAAAFSTGIVIVTDNALVNPDVDLRLGTSPDSIGKLVVTNGGLVVCTNYIGVADSDKDRAYGCVELCDGGVISNSVIRLGYHSRTSKGVLAMRGGLALFHADAVQYNPLRMYDPNHPNGFVRGYGKVAFINPRTMVTEAPVLSGGRAGGMAHYGQIIADGEGVERDLDFGRFGTICYDDAAPNVCGTNGWFAVNKGRLKLPRSLPVKSEAFKCVGDYFSLDYSVETSENSPSNRLANTFSCKFIGATYGDDRFIFSELYALDRSDIPDALSAAIGLGEVISVWRAGYFSDGPEIEDPVNPAAFASAKLHFRCPNHNFDELDQVCVYRHDGSADGKWHLVGHTKARRGWPVVPAYVSSPSAENWNLGWFAVVGRKVPFGTTLLVR